MIVYLKNWLKIIKTMIKMMIRIDLIILAGYINKLIIFIIKEKLKNK